jgi:hypothetical protein
MEKFFLKKYTIPQEYEDIYNYNFSVINELVKNLYFNDTINLLVKISNIDREIIVLDLQRYLMIKNEYAPHCIKKSKFKCFYFLIFVLKLLKRTFVYDSIKKNNKDIVLDKWYKNALKSFYGEKFIDDISLSKKIISLDLENIRISFYVFFKYIKDICELAIIVRKLEKILNISLMHYVYIFFLKFLTGKTLKTKISPKLIISGNDNGFSNIFGKALCDSILLIQNGVRPICSDSTYKYSDYYVMTGTNKEIRAREKMGCVFKNIYPYGSIRLASYLEEKKECLDAKYDVLFVGTSIITFEKDNEYYSYFSIESEKYLLKFLNEYAKTIDKKIAYHCRFRQELDIIKKLGLISDKITYITGEEESVYNTLEKSKLILSLISTVCIEAMALNKKVGFVNFSRNNCYNKLFEDLNIEYTHKNRESFDEFVNRLLKNKIDYSDYVVQELDYIDKLKDIINNKIFISDRMMS